MIESRPTLRGALTRFVSYLRSGPPWYDAHLPLIPLPIRDERPSLPNQRSNLA